MKKEVLTWPSSIRNLEIMLWQYVSYARLWTLGVMLERYVIKAAQESVKRGEGDDDTWLNPVENTTGFDFIDWLDSVDIYMRPRRQMLTMDVLKQSLQLGINKVYENMD